MARMPSPTDGSDDPAAGADSRSRFFVATVCLSIFIAAVYNSPILGGLPKQAIEVGITALPALGIYFAYPRLKARRVSSGAMILAAAYSVAVCLSGLAASGLGTNLALILAPPATAIVMALSGALLTRRELITVGRFVVALGAAQSLLAIAQVQLDLQWAQAIAATQDLGYNPSLNLVLMGLDRASGATGNAILLGALCAIAIVFALAPGVVKNPLLRLLLIALLAWCVLLTGSRSSVTALGVIAAVFLVHPAVKLGLAIRLLLLVVLAPAAWIYLTGTVSDAQELSPFSLSNRVDALARFHAAMARPVGQWLVGQSNGYTESLLTVADNQFLTTTGRYGVIGLLVLLVTIVWALTSRSVTIAAVSASLVFLFLSFDVLSFSSTEHFFWLMVGCSHAFLGSRAHVPVKVKRKRAPMHYPDRVTVRA